MKIEITNYESIGHVDLVVEGFTTIIGRNGLGKSAVLRAVNAALTNQPGTQCIKWGEKFCEVHIVSDTMDILWHKEEGNNHYVINGVKYEKIGKEPPPKVLKEAGYGILRVGQDDKINLAYANQFHPLFLVDKQDSKGVDLITTVYGLDRLYKASDLCSKEQKANADTLKMREKDLQLLEEDLKKLEGLDPAREAIKALEIEKKRIEIEENKLVALREKRQKLVELHTAYKKLSTVSTVSVPDIEKLKASAQTYTKLYEVHKRHEALSASTTRLNVVREVVIPTTKDLNDSRAKVSKLHGLYTTYTELLSYAGKAETLKALVVPNVPEGHNNIQKIRGWLLQIASIKQAHASTTKDMGSLVVDLEKTKEELREYKVCPACGASREGVL